MQVTLAEAAQQLGVSVKTLRNWDGAGKLKTVRTIGNQRRVPVEEIERLKAGDTSRVQMPVKASWVARTCDGCGQEFVIPQWRLNQSPKRGKFCSRKCQGNDYCVVNENFFSSQNSQMAYVLGLLVTDGYLTRKSDGREILCLKLIDRDLLEEVRDMMDSTYGIYFCGKTDAGNDIFRIEFDRRQLIEDVKKYGIVKRKTLITVFPILLEEKYYPDFVRGVLDGDGCVHWHKDKRRNNGYNVQVYFLGTFDLLNGIADVLGTDRKPEPYTAVAKLRFHARQELQHIYDYIYYADDVPCLKRKNAKFKEILALPFNVRPKGSKNKKKLKEQLQIGVKNEQEKQTQEVQPSLEQSNGVGQEVRHLSDSSGQTSHGSRFEGLGNQTGYQKGVG
jgi:excisionase family DNA binding protein